MNGFTLFLILLGLAACCLPLASDRAVRGPSDDRKRREFNRRTDVSQP